MALPNRIGASHYLLKIGWRSSDGSDVEPSAGTSGNAGAVYEALMAERANSQQKVDGANALRLLEAAQIAPAARGSRPLPPDATISIRV